MAAVLKTVDPKGFGGSNPSLSAKKERALQQNCDAFFVYVPVVSLLSRRVWNSKFFFIYLNMKKLFLLLLCSTLVASCSLSMNSARRVVKEKVSALSDLKGAIVESVTLEDGLAALKVTFESGILFGFNQTSISNEAKASLDELVEAISDLPESRIRVYGHTDNVGTHEANLTVSARRANEVSKYLQTKGIGADRITTKGLAFDDPVADNSTEEGRAKNRRVEIYVIPTQ